MKRVLFRLLVGFSIAFSVLADAHERIYRDDDILTISGVILDGQIVDKDTRVLETLRTENEVMYSVEIVYKYYIQKVIRGDFKVGQLLLMSHVVETLDLDDNGSLSVGAKFRYFYDFGRFEDGLFKPNSKILHDEYKQEGFILPISKNLVRSHLHHASK